jgi:hypothetical protein
VPPLADALPCLLVLLLLLLLLLVVRQVDLLHPLTHGVEQPHTCSHRQACRLQQPALQLPQPLLLLLLSWVVSTRPGGHTCC